MACNNRREKRSSRTAMTALLALWSVVTLSAASAGSIEYPTRTIRAIVPYSVGGFTDLTARLISQHLAGELRQQIVVDNRPGAAGNIGMDLAAKSQPDGHTIMFNGSASTQNPALFRKLPFDPLTDLKPVGMITQAPYIVVVHAGLPVSNLGEFIKYGQANAGKLTFSSGGATTRLAAELFMMQHNLSGEAVTYGGTGAAALSIASGQVQFGIMDSSGVMPLVSTGRVKVLAVSGEKRLPSLPNTPTTAEAGFPNYVATTSSSLYVTGKTPNAIARQIHAALNRLLAQPDVRQQIEKMGGYASPMEFEAVAEWYEQEIKRWKAVVARAKLPLAD